LLKASLIAGTIARYEHLANDPVRAAAERIDEAIGVAMRGAQRQNRDAAKGEEKLALTAAY
jgi:hypothetical protein